MIKAKEITPAASTHLDFIRALTAIAVLANHIRGLFFVDYENVKDPNILHKILYFVTGLGHQGVIVFFVLSGLLVGGSVLKAAQAGKWSWIKYLTARLSRLYVVLIPGLILAGIFDAVGLALTHGSFIYAGSPVFGNIITFPIAATHTAKDFLGSLFFLQTILTRAFGSDTPLWSLANEFWYYLLFPLCLFAGINKKNSKTITRVLFGLGALVIFVFVGWSISLLFATWLCGVIALVCCISKSTVSKKLRRLLQVCSIFQFLVFLSIARFGLVRNSILMDILFGFSVAVLLWSVLSFSERRLGRWYEYFSGKFAGFSYTLYVVHLPFIIFIHGLISTGTSYFSAGRWNPDIFHLAAAALIFAVVLIYAYGISIFTEKNTPLVRQKIGEWLELRRRS